MYVSRTIEKFIKKASRQFPVILLTGARQVGKTTLLRHLSSDNRTYVTMDDPLVLTLAKTDPALFFQRFKPPLMIDEIQYATELLPYIKMDVDRTHKPGLFWLTGSQQFHVMKGVSESLAGRVGIIKLLGLSQKEQKRKSEDSHPFLPNPKMLHECNKDSKLSLKELYRNIWRGSYPSIALNRKIDRDLFYSSYIQTYLQRDIRALTNVGDEMSFLRFLRAVAARTGQLLNLTDFARDSDIAPNTAKNWLSMLQTSGIVYLLEPYYTNLTKRFVKTPKLYMLDTGLCSYLTQWSSPETLESGAMSGAIFETFAIVELLKSYWHNGIDAPFYFFRDKDKREIDLIIIRDGTVYPLEIKKTSSPDKSDVRHFKALEKSGMRIGTGGVICLINQPLPLTGSAFSIPIHVV